MNERRQFNGGELTERPDGGAVLEVSTFDGKPLEIHFAPHVWADICSLVDRRRAIGGVANTRPGLEAQIRAERKEASRV